MRGMKARNRRDLGTDAGDRPGRRTSAWPVERRLLGVVAALVGLNAAAHSAAAVIAPADPESKTIDVYRCPVACPGSVRLDIDRAVYPCCRGGACRVCTICPFWKRVLGWC